jgi:hypothetical protein
VRALTIVSPFWAEETGDGPLFTLVQELRRRGFLEEHAIVKLITDAYQLTSTSWLPVLPRCYTELDYKDLGVTAYAQPFDPRILPEEVLTEGFSGTRRLHAKVVLLEGTRTALAYFGSSNFTYSGFGFGSSPANIEAGMIVSRTGKAMIELLRLIPPLAGEPLKLGGHSRQLFAPPESPTKPTWPHFVQDIRLVPNALEPSRLDLSVRVNLGQIKGEWHVTASEAACWTASFRPGLSTDIFISDLVPSILERIMRDQEVRITWWACPEGVLYPVNVDLAARDALPLNLDSTGPNEKMLLAYYQGLISYEELFPPQDEAIPVPSGVTPLTDSSEVDTSRIQSYQIREFVESLDGLREDLKEASFSEQTMRIALLGPVSPAALGRKIKEQVVSDLRSPTAAGFQLQEILRCLLECNKHSHYKKWAGHLQKAITEVESYLSDLKARHPELQVGLFRRYQEFMKTKNCFGKARNK